MLNLTNFVRPLTVLTIFFVVISAFSIRNNFVESIIVNREITDELSDLLYGLDFYRNNMIHL